MILVTGASGFVGGYFLKELAATGAQVRALYHRHPPQDSSLRADNVQWQKADLLDIFQVESALEGVQQVYHCAARVSFDPKDRNEVLFNNVATTENLVNAALDSGVEKMLLLSSIAALGRNGTVKMIDEESDWEESGFNSIYARSKYHSELEVWRGIGEGLNAVILNPGIILGAPLQKSGWQHGSPKLLLNAANEFPFYTDGINAFVSVQDLVSIGIQLMQSKINSERFVVSAGNFSYKEIFEMMADALGKKRPHIHAGKIATGLVWRWFWLKSKLSGKAPLITKETARNAQAKCHYSSEKLSKALPNFQYQNMEDTIREMAKAYTSSLD